MYTSTRNFPQFAGKDKAFSSDCIKYALKKEPQLVRHFLYAVVAVLGSSVAYAICANVALVPAFLGMHQDLILLAVVGFGFYAFLLAWINIDIYPAVVRHIAEFESQSSTSSPAPTERIG